MASSSKIARWVRATLLGPFITCWTIVTAASILLPSDLYSRIFFDVDTWALGMWLVSLFASAVAVCLIAVDVTFLKYGLRRLPSGGSGLFSSMLAPIAVWIVWAVIPTSDQIPFLVLSLAGGLWIGAASVRLLFGKRP